MEGTGKDVYNMFNYPSIFETCADVMMTIVPFWMAIVVGLVVGWSWKPRWVSFLVLALRSRPRLIWSTPPGFGARRAWLALTALTAFPFVKVAWTKFCSWMWPDTVSHGEDLRYSNNSMDGGSKRTDDSEDWVLSTEDLIDFYKRVNNQDGGAPWNIMLEKSTDNLIYQAWRREPLDGAGPTEYRSRTLVDDYTPEMLRDFFWDDEFRKHWDNMLIFSKTWEECPRTGSMVVQWVRKFPVFCKDREYVISRRIWAAGNTYYCVTKGVQYSNVPRKIVPQRVDHYFSSWSIRPVESSSGDASCTAVEVLCFHHEDMGIQRDLAKLGVRKGMWGCVKKMVPGLKLYKELRQQAEPSLKHVLPAHVCTEVSPNFAESLSLPGVLVAQDDDCFVLREKSLRGVGCLRWFILGGAVALACGVDKGAVGKVLVFGLARRLGRVNRNTGGKY